jgi:hypothetical protein
VWRHGEAGAIAGPGLIAEDLLDALRTLRGRGDRNGRPAR